MVATKATPGWTIFCTPSGQIWPNSYLAQIRYLASKINVWHFLQRDNPGSCDALMLFPLLWPDARLFFASVRSTSAEGDGFDEMIVERPLVRAYSSSVSINRRGELALRTVAEVKIHRRWLSLNCALTKPIWNKSFWNHGSHTFNIWTSSNSSLPIWLQNAPCRSLEASSRENGLIAVIRLVTSSPSECIGILVTEVALTITSYVVGR